MKIRALVSFAGAFSMYKGQETECSDDTILRDLFKAKYVEEVQDQEQKVKTEKPKKGVKVNEGK